MIYGEGFLLLSSVGGYWVLERAETHKGSLRKVGRLLGSFIIVASLVGLVARVWCFAACKPGGGMGMGQKAAFCPFSRTAPPTP